MKTPILIATGSFLIAAAALKAAPAFAEPVQPQNVSVVHTTDLDLSSETGRRALNQRLVIAAREVCGEASDVDLVGKNAVRQCRKDTLAEARAKGERLASRADGSILIAAIR
jgi:UrcA family protein